MYWAPSELGSVIGNKKKTRNGKNENELALFVLNNYALGLNSKTCKTIDNLN